MLDNACEKKLYGICSVPAVGEKEQNSKDGGRSIGGS
jgi:hypothetical protein